MRGATFADENRIFVTGDFYSHASCEARHWRQQQTKQSAKFLLTRLLRGATGAVLRPAAGHAISTHTPLARRDIDRISIRSIRNDFYSHAPCGARPMEKQTPATQHIFLLTRPMRGATRQGPYTLSQPMISTHTPHAGRDSFSCCNFKLFVISTHTPHAGRDLCRFARML